MTDLRESPVPGGPPKELRLRNARGEWRGKLPRAPRDFPPEDEGAVRDALADGLVDLWKKFRRRARRGIPGPRSPELDEVVHDLRSAARRFHSVARALPPAARRRSVRKAVRVAKKILDWTGPLRDLTVEHEGLKGLRGRWSKAVQELSRDLGRRHDRRARKLAKRLHRVKLKRVHRRMLRFARKLRGKRDTSAVASEMAARAFGEVREARRNVDPTDPRSVHQLRIALKRFRSLFSLFEPALPAGRRGPTGSVRSLQRTMGDVRDAETLTSELAGEGKRNPGTLQETAALLRTLEERRGRMMTSFLGAVDAILGYWGRFTDSFRGGLRRGKAG